MTGPEHYREAERLAQWAGGYPEDEQPDNAHIQAAQIAQVHATLALAAAAAIGSTDLPSGDWDDWRFVASAGHAGRIPGSEREARYEGEQ